MCGIAGIYNLNRREIDKNLVKEMTGLMSHRGPDDEGFYFEKHIGLGHRRLSVVDLSKAGHQPMSNEDDSVWISHNGEIYNYLEIREELENRGHVFKSKTDTEVILHSYEEWGSACLNKLNGMWAFAIWDRKKQELFCSRDRFGIKPFHYFFDGEIFAFASEIKALMSIPNFRREPNERLIYDYLSFGILSRSEETFFRNIKSIKPGYYLVFKDNNLKTERYYKIFLNTKLGVFKEGDCKKFSQEFLWLLKDSIKMRIRSDVNVGFCLSGGLDSSSIVCLANEMFDKNTDGICQKTFSACFCRQGFDERKYIQKIIDSVNVQCNYVFPSCEKLWREIEDLIWYQEEPFISTSVYAQWNLMKIVKQENVKVLLDGQGGDELLAGYNRYFGIYFNQLVLSGKLLELRREFTAMKRISEKPTKFFILYLLKGLGAILPRSLAIFAAKKLAARSNFMSAYLTKTCGKRNGVISNPKSKTNLQKRLWQDENSELQPLLRYEDRSSMAFSIETRLPFLDHRLVEYAFSLPACYKIHNGWTKYLLRMNLENPLPEEVRWRRDKVGFLTPEAAWLERSRDKIKEIFISKSFRSEKYANRKLILNEIDGILLRKKDAEISKLWRFINLELWLRRFF